MRQLKRFFSNVVVVLVAFAQILPSASTVATAETNPTLKVQVVGEGSVTVSHDTTSWYVDSSEDFEQVFEEGTELDFDVLSDTGIKSITEDGQTVVDAQGEALKDYLNNTDYQFEYKTSSEDKTIVVAFNSSSTSSETEQSGEKEEQKEDTSTEEKTDDRTMDDYWQWANENVGTSNGSAKSKKLRSSGYTSFSSVTGNQVDGNKVVEIAKSLLGTPYVFGAKNPRTDGGIDCSGFVTYVYRTYLGTMWYGSTQGGYSYLDEHYVGSTEHSSYCNSGSGRYDMGSWDYVTGHYYMDQYGLGSPNLFDANAWDFLLRNGKSSTLLRVGISSSLATTGTLPSDIDSYSAGDIVIFYTDADGNVCPQNSGQVHMGIYMGNGQVIHSSASGNGVAISNLTDIRTGSSGGSPKAYRIWHIVEGYGNLQLEKASSNTDITDGNNCYGSMEGAEYGLYSDEACTKKVGTFTIGKDGKSNVIEKLEARKTYYIKETKAPEGYALDTSVHHATIESGKTQVKSVKDTPQSDPILVVLKKKDSSSKDGQAQGEATLEGAEFTVKYYDVQSKTDPAEDGAEAVRTWVLKTNSDGKTAFADSLKVSGDEFYKDSTGANTLPLGTITIQETKAPEGYELNDEVYVRQITSDGKAEAVETYNEPTVKEDVMTGRFGLTKFMTDGEKSEQVEPEVGAEFTAVLEKYYTKAEGDMTKALELAKANGNEKEYSILKTDKQGEASSGELAYGTYIVKQTKVGKNGEESWELDETFKFTVSSKDGQAYVYGELADGRQVTASEDGLVHYYINNVPVTSGVKIVKKDADTGEIVSYNQATFKIKKYNKDGEVVTDYNKKTVRTDKDGYVSIKVGTQWYDTFVTNAENKVSVADAYQGGSKEEQGSVTLPVALPSGDYSIEETSSPDGYLLTDGGKFTISKSKITGTDEDGQPLLTYTVSDPKPTGEITLKKTFDSDERLHGTVTFDLYATEDILNPATGEIQYAKDEKIGTYELGEDDTITISNLPLGTGESSFKLVEASTYENYKLNQEEKTVTFKQKDQTTTTYSDTVKVKNETIKISTKALNAKTDGKEFNSAKKIKVTDVVSYDGLTKGQAYTLHATLIDKETGEAVKNADGEVVEGIKNFTAEDETGEVKVNMTLDASQIGGKDFVVYESLYNTGSKGHEGCAIAKHEDINDEDQTITIKKSEIGTTAKSEKNGTHEQQVTDGKVTLTDTVKYKNLVKGMDYVVKGTLMDKSTGEAFKDADGKKVTAEATFTAEDENGTVDVAFEFDASKVKANTDLVVFETLYEVNTDTEGVKEEIEVTEHKNIEDEGQTITFIDVHTTAKAENGSDETQATDETIKLIDTVSYEGLKVGKEYTVKGTLMNQETGEALLVDGEKVTAETTFTPETSDGTVDVTFEFSGKGITAGTNIVVFEDLKRDGIKIATHSDITDKDQTIDIVDVKTTAISDKGNNTALSGVSEVTITDIVYYTNLQVGKEYTVKGKLMNKETGEVLLDADGKEVTGEKTFTAEKKDGTVEVEFKLNSSLLAGKVTVVFEDLYKDDIKVATHSDLSDKDQTIRFKNFHVKVNKIDSNTKKNITSEKFEFTMFSDKDCKNKVKTVAGNTETGVAEFEVEEGTWYIKETKAPDGYKISDELIKVEVKNKTLYINGEEKDTDDEYVCSIVFANSMLPSEKVKTGANTNQTLYMELGLGSLVLIALLYFYRKKHQKAE